MPDTPSIVLVKSFPYRGKAEEFSNRYHFSGATPDDAAEWKSLALSFWSWEGLSYSSLVTFVRAYGYEAGVEHSVAQIDFTVPGPPPAGVFVPADWDRAMPGDVAATARWYTGALNSRGKKIYCRKYVHGVFRDVDGSDQLDDLQKAQLVIMAGKMIDGSLLGGRKYCGPQAPCSPSRTSIPG